MARLVDSRMPPVRDLDGSNVSRTERDSGEQYVSEMAEPDDVQTAIYAGWDPLNAGSGWAGDDFHVTSHPAYRMPTRFQGSTLDEMGF